MRYAGLAQCTYQNQRNNIDALRQRLGNQQANTQVMYPPTQQPHTRQPTASRVLYSGRTIVAEHQRCLAEEAQERAESQAAREYGVNQVAILALDPEFVQNIENLRRAPRT